jgi:hypothetical protein
MDHESLVGCGRLNCGGIQQKWDFVGCWPLDFVGGIVRHVHGGNSDESDDDDGRVGRLIVCEVTR